MKIDRLIMAFAAWPVLGALLTCPVQSEEPFSLGKDTGWVGSMCPPTAAATALVAYQMYLFCDLQWREIGALIREKAFAECLAEQKARGVEDAQRQKAECEEIYAILEGR